MDSYKYSLIIPHHNMPQRLNRLIKTIPLRSDLQVIVVDDCSNKNIDEYNKLKIIYPWIEWYSTGTNGGAGKARNIGLEYSKGMFILFADSDDFFTPCFNESLNKYIDKSYDIVYFFSCCLNEHTYRNDNYLNFINKLLKDDLENPTNIRFKITYPWAKIYRKNFLKENNIKFEESLISNDVRFSTLCDFYAKHITIDEKAIYCYMNDSNSISKSLNPNKIYARLKIDLWRWKFIVDNNKENRLLKKIILGRTFSKIIDIKDKGKLKKTFKITREFNLSTLQFLYFIMRSYLRSFYYYIK